jgi:hypothetical protein
LTRVLCHQLTTRLVTVWGFEDAVGCCCG